VAGKNRRRRTEEDVEKKGESNLRLYAIKKSCQLRVCHEKILKHVYVMHPKFVDAHAILDGFRQD
jgi:hypothetical protein